MSDKHLVIVVQREREQTSKPVKCCVYSAIIKNCIEGYISQLLINTEY